MWTEQAGQGRARSMLAWQAKQAAAVPGIIALHSCMPARSRHLPPPGAGPQTIMARPQSFFDASTKGDLVSRLTVDVTVLQTTLAGAWAPWVGTKCSLRRLGTCGAAVDWVRVAQQ